MNMTMEMMMLMTIYTVEMGEEGDERQANPDHLYQGQNLMMIIIILIIIIVIIIMTIILELYKELLIVSSS